MQARVQKQARFADSTILSFSSRVLVDSTKDSTQGPVFALRLSKLVDLRTENQGQAPHLAEWENRTTSQRPWQLSGHGWPDVFGVRKAGRYLRGDEAHG